MLFLPADFAGGVRLRTNASRTPLVPVGPRRIAGREALEGEVHPFQRHDDRRDVAIDMWSLRLEEKIAVARLTCVPHAAWTKLAESSSARVTNHRRVERWSMALRMRRRDGRR